jgi:CubicO group peptidase (beta-lactamase class C family)
MSRNMIAGGVVVVGNRDGILYSACRGQISSEPGAPPIDERTVFDIASLTKVVATAPAVMKLLDDGLIRLSDPLSRWFPEFARKAQGEISILNLLTHTSGLTDFDLSRHQSMRMAVKRAAAQRRQWTGRFDYADINFILLGELVRRASGQPLDVYCRRRIYTPLGASDTTFLPPQSSTAGIAPTAGFRSGVVGDPNARRLGGVAGHAGVFSSAYDLSRFARLILGGGIIDDKRILSEQAVAQMTTSYLCNSGQVRRGLGWDINSPFSSPKGRFFSETSFGHTGYSGSSIWIDPQHDRFVILLTRRVNYSYPHGFSQLRNDVSTIASANLKMAGDDCGLGRLKVDAGTRRPLPPEVAIAMQPSLSNHSLSVQSGRKREHQPRAQLRCPRAKKVVKIAHSARKRRKVTRG